MNHCDLAKRVQTHRRLQNYSTSSNGIQRPVFCQRMNGFPAGTRPSVLSRMKLASQSALALTATLHGLASFKHQAWREKKREEKERVTAKPSHVFANALTALGMTRPYGCPTDVRRWDGQDSCSGKASGGAAVGGRTPNQP
eukprot:scaffold256_cov261-Pinguiococcus_pyrenoidosus.AAC.20